MSADRQHKARTLWLVGVLHAFTHLYSVALMPLYLRIQQDLKLTSIEQATLLVTVMGLAYFIPSYPLGVLADRVSRKKLLASGLAINAVGFLGLAFAPNYPWALACVVLAGAGGAFYHPAATALIARLFPEARGRALGLVGIGASVGFFLGPLYSGWRAVLSGSWRAPVGELGLLGLLAAGLFAWLADEERPAPTPSPHTASPDLALRPPAQRLFPSAAMWTFFLAACFFFSWRDFAGSAMATSASLFFQNAHHFNPKVAGAALSGIFLTAAVSNPLFGRLSDRGRIRWMSLVLFLAAALIALFPRVPVGWMVPVLLAYGFFFMASYPISEAALMEAVPDSVRGRVFGLFITLCGLLGNLSHWMVGDWVKHLGPRAASPHSYFPLYTLLSLLVLGSLAAMPFLHALRQREQAFPTTPLKTKPAHLPV